MRQVADQIDKLVAVAVNDLARQQRETARTELDRWEKLSEWLLLTPEDQQWFREEASRLALNVSPDMDGLRRLLAQDYDLNHRLRDLGRQVIKRGKQQAPDPEEGKSKEDRGIYTCDLALPATLNSVDEIKALIQQLEKLIAGAPDGQTFHIRWKSK